MKHPFLIAKAMIQKVRQPSRVYLDYAGATPVSPLSEAAFIEAIGSYGNASAIHREGVEAGRFLDKARAKVATVLNAHAYEIYFMSSGTESANLATLGVYEGLIDARGKTQGASNAGAGTNMLPHIITTTIEHPAVLEAVWKLEKEKKVTATYIPVDTNGVVKVKDVREALRPETMLVSVMYANNEMGVLQPIKEIGRMIEEWKKGSGRTHTAYPYFHTDACQAANYCNLDVVRLRVHLMTINSSKVYGPKGSAALYKREGISLGAMTYGGGQERHLRSGTEAVPLHYAFSVALHEAKEIQEKEVWRLQLLNDYFVAEIKKAIPSIVFYGTFDEIKTGHDTREVQKVVPAQELLLPRNDAMEEHVGVRIMRRLPNNINCRVPGISSEEMILRLDAKGFAVSHKSACASRESDGSYVIEALGGTREESLENIRITMGRQTTKKDMERLVEGMRYIADEYTG